MWTEVCFGGCRHTVKVQLYGSGEARERRKYTLEHNSYFCPECEKKRKAEAIKEKYKDCEEVEMSIHTYNHEYNMYDKKKFSYNKYTGTVTVYVPKEDGGKDILEIMDAKKREGCEAVAMPYAIYATFFDLYDVKSDSYDRMEKTIIVYVPLEDGGKDILDTIVEVEVPYERYKDTYRGRYPKKEDSYDSTNRTIVIYMREAGD